MFMGYCIHTVKREIQPHKVGSYKSAIPSSRQAVLNVRAYVGWLMNVRSFSLEPMFRCLNFLRNCCKADFIMTVVSLTQCYSWSLLFLWLYTSLLISVFKLGSCWIISSMSALLVVWEYQCPTECAVCKILSFRIRPGHSHQALLLLGCSLASC